MNKCKGFTQQEADELIWEIEKARNIDELRQALIIVVDRIRVNTEEDD